MLYALRAPVLESDYASQVFRPWHTAATETAIFEMLADNGSIHELEINDLHATLEVDTLGTDLCGLCNLPKVPNGSLRPANQMYLRSLMPDMLRACVPS